MRPQRLLPVGLAGIVLALAGCQAKSVKDPYLDAQPTPAATIAHRDQRLESRSGGFGVLLMTKGMAVNLQACKSFFETFVFVPYDDKDKIVTEDGERFVRRPSYWLDARSAEQAPDIRDDCNTLVARYDYDRALRRLTGIDRVGKRGPILVAYKSTGKRALLFDLSDAPPRAFERAFREWHEQILNLPDPPEVIEMRTSARDRVRDFLNEYGALLASVIISPAKALE